MSMSMKGEQALEAASIALEQTNGYLKAAIGIGYALLSISEQIYGLRETLATVHDLVPPKQ